MVFNSLHCCHSSQKSFFRLHQKNKSSESNLSSERLVIVAKGFLKLLHLHVLLKKKESITSLKLGSRDLWRIAKSIVNKDKSVVSPLFNGPEMLSSASDKAKLSAKKFSKNSNLDDSGTSLPVFLPRTNLKLHNISETPTIIKKITTKLDSSKTSDPDCIPVVVLKNCYPELSYILA